MSSISEGNLEWLFDKVDLVSDESSTCDEDLIAEAKAKIGNVGRPSIVEKHPEMVDAIKDYIEQNTAGAHLCRRNSVMYSNSITLREIAAHIKSTFNLTISKDTIHRLLLPRRRKTVTSRRYKMLIAARIPPKRNSSVKVIHEDFHYTSAQVSLVNKISQLCKDNTLALLVDNKIKVEVGNPATSWRCQIRKFYLVNDGPNYVDHDFPHPNTKITPAGYQVRMLRPTRSRSLSPPSRPEFLKRHRRSLSAPGGRNIFGTSKISQDKIGRPKVEWPRSGPLHVQLYPCRSIESTSVMHMNFLKHLITQLKKQQPLFNVVAVADGGPDWSVKGVLNLMVFGSLWQSLQLDTLTIQCYAPGHSRFNPIERSWSLLTKLIVGVILPVEIAELDFTVPGVSDDEEWKVVLDNAINELRKFWHGRHYDTFPISVHPFFSKNPAIPSLKTLHETLKEFSEAGVRKLASTPIYQQLMVKYNFFVKHCNRKSYQIEFLRCEGVNCDHCSSMPVRKNAFLELMRNFGGTLPTPTPSDIFKDHYKSLEEMLLVNSSTLNKNIARDIVSCSGHGICPYAGCNYAFFSKADQDRHFRLMGHPPKEAACKDANLALKGKRKVKRKATKSKQRATQEKRKK